MDDTENPQPLRDALRWMKDESGAFVATFGMIAVFYGLGVFLVYAYLQLDAQFSRPLAGDVIPPQVTQQIAWGVRAFSVVVGMAAIYCHVNDMPRFRRLMIMFGGVAAILLLLHAYGIAAKVMEGQYTRTATIEKTETVNIAALDEQIATLQAAKSEWRADAAAVVSSNQAAIANITSDGIDNDDEADAFRAANTAAQTALDAKIADADQRIFDLQARKLDVSTVAIDDGATVTAFNPLFTLIARVSSWTWNPGDIPPDTHSYVAGIAFFTLFFGFGELLMITCFTVGYAMAKIVAEKRREDREAARRSKAAERAWETRRQNEADTDRQARRSGKMIEGALYYKQLARAMVEAKQKRPKMTMKGLRDTYAPDMTLAQMDQVLRRCMQYEVLTREEYDFLTGTPVTSKPNGKDEQGLTDDRADGSGADEDGGGRPQPD